MSLPSGTDPKDAGCPKCGSSEIEEIYEVTYICDNCNHGNEMGVPKGTPLRDVPCPNCGVKALRAVEDSDESDDSDECDERYNQKVWK